jgi:hypothetical protein
MTNTASLPRLFSSGVELEEVDWLRDSSALIGNTVSLRQRMNEDGYLYLPGLLHRQVVLDARREILRRMAAEGCLDPAADLMLGRLLPNSKLALRPDLTRDNAPLAKVLYEGPLMAFFAQFLGGAVRHFDFTWLRTIQPGPGTPSHMDSVYMNRGTHNLYTVWTPLGDIDATLGGLMIMEGSNNNTRLKETYGLKDVDAYCENKPEARAWGKSWGTGGSLKGNPNQIRRSIGRGINGQTGKWLTTQYQAGDVLIFSIFTVHASLDNRSERLLRLSSDTRYQLASEPADERWIGADPVGHGEAGKRGKIC